MTYSKVRTYLNNIIASVNPDFTEHKDAFNDENIAKSNFDKAYHIFYTVPSISKSDYTINSNMTASVSFFFKGFRDPQESLDVSMDLVNDVALAAGSIENLATFRSTDDFPIQACDPISQTPEPLESNDNAMKITLELNMSVFQTLC